MPANPYGPAANDYDRGDVVMLDEAIIYQGNLVVVNTSTGEASPAVKATASRRVIGWAKETVDNTDDGESVPVSRAPRAFAGKSGDLPTVIGQTVYVEDENTVKATADGSNPVTAGTILAIKDGKYFINFAL